MTHVGRFPESCSRSLFSRALWRVSQRGIWVCDAVVTHGGSVVLPQRQHVGYRCNVRIIDLDPSIRRSINGSMEPPELIL